jgi:hypothetical protein
MGRPLNKRFFNPVPATNGEGVASVTMGNTGTYSSLPTVTFDPPGLPGGVTATGVAIMELRSVTINNAGAGYTAGDVLVIGGGAVVEDTTAGTYTAQAQIVVDTVDGVTGEITAFTALSVRGAYSVLPTKVVGGSNATNLSLDGGTGNNARVNVTWRVKEIQVTDSGSGYVTAADAAITFAPVSTTTATAVLTTTGTDVILAQAFVVGGTQALPADIVKQTSTNEYVMVTTEGESIVTLVANANPTEGQAYIRATDALGSTYFVTKLTARLAVLEQWTVNGSFVYESGDAAPWSFDISGDTEGMQVQIASA